MMESIANSTKDPDKVKISAMPDCTTIAIAGVWILRWTRANIGCPNPSCARAKRYRGPTNVELPTFPKIEIIAPTVIKTASAGPENTSADSASGELDSAKPGNVPTATTCTNV